MAKIKKIGLNLIGVFSNRFKADEVLPNEFAEFKKQNKVDYTDFMY